MPLENLLSPLLLLLLCIICLIKFFTYRKENKNKVMIFFAVLGVASLITFIYKIVSL